MFHCGESYPHMTGPCPAKGKTCNKCNKKNHYTKCCKSKHVKQIYIPNEATELDDYVFTTESFDHKRPTTNIKLCDTKIRLLVDTGTSVNLLNEHTYCDLCFVVEGSCSSLLSYQSAESLHIIDIINATTCNLKDIHTYLFRDRYFGK